jgi:hypothetical protein
MNKNLALSLFLDLASVWLLRNVAGVAEQCLQVYYGWEGSTAIVHMCPAICNYLSGRELSLLFRPGRFQNVDSNEFSFDACVRWTGHVPQPLRCPHIVSEIEFVLACSWGSVLKIFVRISFVRVFIYACLNVCIGRTLPSLVWATCTNHFTWNSCLRS